MDALAMALQHSYSCALFVYRESESTRVSTVSEVILQ
jgi:hypothetical protein